MATDMHEFLKPLHMDVATAHALSLEFARTFTRLAAESQDQFLPTPISEGILRPEAGQEKGRYLAMDIGGTNLRVGFIQLLGHDVSPEKPVNGSEHDNDEDSPHIRRILEKSWPIMDHLKMQGAADFFDWVGSCIAEVVAAGCKAWSLPAEAALPMGVTFSFPMAQRSISEALMMPMGKGFTMSADQDLGTYLVEGYNQSKQPGLPPIEIAAILNDSVATLVSFIYQCQEDDTHKAVMGLICGTGSNATIPMRKSMLHPDKLPGKVRVPAGDPADDVRVCVNTEWTINGTATVLKKFGLVSKWDTILDSEGEAPGFQPLEYMVAGRYLGELGRLMMVDYLTNRLKHSPDTLPPRLLQRMGLSTTFLSHYRPLSSQSLLNMLETEFPTAGKGPFQWTREMAQALYKIAKAIETRAAGLIAAATIGLLMCTEAIETRETSSAGQANGKHSRTQLNVGYTGGCIVHFQDYLVDCQGFLDSILQAEMGDSVPVRVVLQPCHDGGITGAGILCGSAMQPTSNVSP